MLLYSPAMRACLSFFLATMLSLNAAYAAVVGVCDALEHTSSHAAHFGHHSHDHVHDEPAADADRASNMPAVGDHHHAHVHPVFSSLPATSVGVKLLAGCITPVADPGSTFVSAPQALLDRPPRATLA
ncbi:MAG: hypothetical protein EPN14_10955 [Gallionella sp.]|nr:MAG: hypothetical protein EPN14_10955 [Gallionella sp.]